MTIHSLRQKFGLALLLVPVIFLPSCWWNKSSEKNAPAGGKVLVTMGGKAVITSESFDREFDQLIEENPHLKQVLAIMPDAKKNFLMGMVNQEVVDKWVTDNRVDQKDDYRREFDRMMRSVRRMLNTKYFGLEHPIQVSDAELNEFYDKNKDSMPDLVVSRGGVKAVGVSFDKEVDAKAFMTKVRESKDITKAADAAKLNKNLRDFKLVNAQSIGMDAALRDKIVALDKLPALEVVKVSDKSFWVVSATAREEAKYRPLTEVKAGLEQYVAKEKRMQLFDQEIAKLKTDYNVAINEDALRAEEAPKVADATPAGEAQVAQTAPAEKAAEPAAPAQTAPAQAPVETAKAA